MTGKNIWRLCKVYGRMIGYPELKPHDLRHGVAMEVLEQQHDLEQVRALLGHSRIDTNHNKNNLVAPAGFEPVFQPRSRFRQYSRVIRSREPRHSRTRLKHAA